MLKNNLFLLIAIALFVLGALYFVSLPSLQEPAAANTAQANEAVEPVAQNDITPLSAQAVESALQDRILGDVNAPIKISEHSSFTCGHCGHFHKAYFKDVKAQLIDTGKAYMVFADFPLNTPALHASMITRCAPQEHYFDFVQALFEEQDKWAYEPNYTVYLTQRARDFGMDKESVESCLATTALQDGLVAKRAAAQNTFQVKSTPSFVVNNARVITGAYPAEEFMTKVNEAIGSNE